MKLDKTKRKFLTAGGAALGASLVAGAAGMMLPKKLKFAAIQSCKPENFNIKIAKTESKRLHFKHLHTGETEDILFYSNGELLTDALADINHILRDHRTGDVERIDPKLIMHVHNLYEKLGSNSKLHIISGYRSPRTNAMLRGRSEGVAKKSYHMKGMALDIRLDDRHVRDISKTARAMARGGVGGYTKSNFVHIDTGPTRSWGA